VSGTLAGPGETVRRDSLGDTETEFIPRKAFSWYVPIFLTTKFSFQVRNVPEIDCGPLKEYVKVPTGS
jgi:hypothetical protein